MIPIGNNRKTRLFALSLFLFAAAINGHAANARIQQQSMPSMPSMPAHNVASRPQVVQHPHNFTHNVATVNNNAAVSNNAHPKPSVSNNHPNNNHFGHNQNNSNNNGYFYNNVAVPYYVAPVDDDSYSYTEPEEEDNDQNNVSGNAWSSGSDGEVPQNAVSYQDDNGMTVYYCRSLYNSVEYYGYLVPDDGCYVDDQSTTLRFEQYEVLVQD